MDLTWSILHPIKKEWLEVGVKGSVQETLIKHGELPDPFEGTNEEKFGWIEEYQWEFKSLFFLTKNQLQSDFVELDFPSVDTYAKFYLNGTFLFETSNAFRPYFFQIKEIAKEGLNELTVVFTPPVIYHKDKLEEVGYQLPAPNDVHEVAIAPYARKPQYQFGWDWALRMNTIGFSKTAKVRTYDVGRIINKTTRVISVDEKQAVVEFDIVLSNQNIEEIIWESKLFGPELVKSEDGFFTRREVVLNPRLWWPRGHGESFLYSDPVIVKDIDNQVVDNIDFKYGIKTSELVQDKDEWGTSYYFKINGKSIFCKGADYIPQEIFPSQVTDSSVQFMIDQMYDANFNMVRVWGGGYYPDEHFFNRCDELGIMVWQDLMFACAMYPGDESFLCNVRKELDYQIPRISAHPSVMLFNGNNEVEVAWGNWGFQVKYGLFGKKARTIEKAYDNLFKKLAPSIVEKWTLVPYIHTSPLSNWGKEEFYNHGSQHYWGVWHGKDPLEDFGKKIGRFNAEYGFQSFPEYNTLKQFASKNNWQLDSDVMKHHQKSYVGNEMILKHATRLYGEPSTFEEFVYFSQLTQAHAVSMAVAGHRLDAPRCGGTLYWQLNDCWPAPTWSSIDYYGNWKALHYQMKKDYQDVSIVAKYEGLNDKSFYLISDLDMSLESNVELKVFDLDGNEIFHKDSLYTVVKNLPVNIEIEKMVDSSLLNTNCVIVFQFTDQHGTVCKRQFDHIIKPYDKAERKGIQLQIEELDEENGRGVLKVISTDFARSVWITSQKFGFHLDSNFESLFPGETRIPFSFNEKPALEDLKINWL